MFVETEPGNSEHNNKTNHDDPENGLASIKKSRNGTHINNKFYYTVILTNSITLISYKILCELSHSFFTEMQSKPYHDQYTSGKE